MKRFTSIPLSIVLLTAAPAFANVIVASPHAGDTLTSKIKFAATANTSTCAKGVASMGVYIDNALDYVVNGATLNTSLTLPAGKHNATIQAWDFCGGATTTSVLLTVTNKAGVWVSSPAPHASVAPLTSYVATATTGCATGVAAMGIYVNHQLMFVVNGASLDTQINLAPAPSRPSSRSGTSAEAQPPRPSTSPSKAPAIHLPTCN